MLSQLTGTLGMAGSILGTVPLSSALHAFGWTTTSPVRRLTNVA
jgi:hypothetical protein